MMGKYFMPVFNKIYTLWSNIVLRMLGYYFKYNNVVIILRQGLATYGPRTKFARDVFLAAVSELFPFLFFVFQLDQKILGQRHR